MLPSWPHYLITQKWRVVQTQLKTLSMVCKVIKRGLSGWSWPIQGSRKWEPQGHAFMQVAPLWHHHSHVCSKEVRNSDRSLRKWARTSFLPCAFKRTQSPVRPMSSASGDSGLGACHPWRQLEMKKVQIHMALLLWFECALAPLTPVSACLVSSQQCEFWL